MAVSTCSLMESIVSGVLDSSGFQRANRVLMLSAHAGRAVFTKGLSNAKDSRTRRVLHQARGGLGVIPGREKNACDRHQPLHGRLDGGINPGREPRGASGEGRSKR